MLIKFTVSNSRSIGEELVFSAIATNDNTLPEALIDVPKYGIKLLKTMALFGANASGKSNVLKAMGDAMMFIVKEKEKPEKDSKRPILNTFFNNWQ
jgi:AAA15 family ATPase/GTPase